MNWNGRCRKSCRGLPPSSLFPVAESLKSRIAPRSSGHAAARMCARSAKIETVDRSAVLGPPRYGTHKKELLQPKISVKDVAFG